MQAVTHDPQARMQNDTQLNSLRLARTTGCMTGLTKEEVQAAKEKLDTLIGKQRAIMYKPIQIAEVLSAARKGILSIEDIKDNLETYRNPSKKWRDVITTRLVNQVCTSSQKFQDNIFDNNAVPPSTLAILAEENIKHDGIVERYLYQAFWEKQKQIIKMIDHLQNSKAQEFELKGFLEMFVKDKGMKRSIDKAYEIVVYALFSTLVRHLDIRLRLSAGTTNTELLGEFKEFLHLVVGLDPSNPILDVEAQLYRAGSTNAADRGLDIWSNFGPVIQIKHLTLTNELAEDICEEIEADRIVIVCLDSEREIIERVLSQLGHRVQSIVTESQLIDWYERALRGSFSGLLATALLESLLQQFLNEFPFAQTFESFYEERGYADMVSSDQYSASIFMREDL